MSKKKKYIILMVIVLALFLISYKDLFNLSNSLIYTLEKNFDNSIFSGFDTNSLKSNMIFAIYVGLFLLIFVYVDTTKGKKVSMMFYLLLIISIFLKKVLIFFIMYVLIFPVILIVGVKNDEQKRKQREEEKKLFLMEEREKFKKKHFNKEEENSNITKAFNTFVAIQTAYTNFDYDILKKSISDELYNVYSEELNSLKSKGQKKIMTDFELVGAEVIKVKEFNNRFSVVMHMEISLFEYIIDTNKKSVSGDSKEKKNYLYELHFEYNKEAKIECPNCGAQVNFDDKKCNYCNVLLFDISVTPKLISIKKR